jgi:hypothetical protein
MEYIPYTTTDIYAPLYGRCPLLRRAWVFQERLLSPRIIHFAACQLIWECNSMWKSQVGNINLDWTNGDGPRRLDNIYSPFKRAKDNVRDDWTKIVTDYAGLDMTYSKDRLPALAAVVERTMLSRLGDTYIAGLWKDSMIQELLWARLESPTLIPNVPTWSWACLTDGIFFRDIDMPTASISNISIKEIGPPQLGNAVGAVISLQCKYFVATLRPKNRLQRFCIDYQETEIHTNTLDMSFCFTEDYDLYAGSRPLQESDRVFIVFLGYNRVYFNWAGLALRQVSSTEFERIGCFLMDSESRTTSSIRKARPGDNMEFRIRHSFVYSLPTREFRII